MLTFSSISKLKPGGLAVIINKSYAALLETASGCWQQEKKKWDNFDQNAFANPVIGKCVFVTCLNNKPIGFASYDPRPWPEYGEIGQNCILPEYQGKGYGKQQIAQILKIFKENSVKKAVVTTSEHPFFISAQKLYQSLGFKEVKRFPGGPDPNYGLIKYEINLL